MKKLLFLVYTSISKKKKAYAIFILQIFIAVMMLNIAAALIKNGMLLENLSEKSGIMNCGFFSPDLRFSDPLETSAPGYISPLEKVISDLKYLDYYGGNVQGIAKISDGDENYPIYGTSLNLLEKAKMPLLSGRWFKETDSNSKELPIIISSDLLGNFKVGDKMVLKVMDNVSNEYVPYKAQIIGILKKPDYILNLGGSGSLDSVFSMHPKTIITPYAKEIFKFDIIGGGGSLLLFPDKNTDKNKVYKEWESKLKGLGSFDKFSDYYATYKDDNLANDWMYLSIGLIVLILALSGIGGNNALSLIDQEKEFAIYFMCGMKWKMCILINLLKDIIIILLPGILSYLGAIIFNNMADMNEIIVIDNSQLPISIGLCLIIFAITSLEPLIRLYRKNPVTIIREWV